MSATIKTRIRFAAALLALASALLPGPALHADDAVSLRQAKRLLTVSGTEQHYQNIAERQTRDIIRTYSSIVNMSVDVRLPEHLTNSIAECYGRVYAWEIFEDGIATILSRHLSQKEMLILIDFYRNLGLPPQEIDTFKATIAKAPSIEQVTADYIFDNSDSCVDKDAALIDRYLSTLNLRTARFSAP